MTCRMPGPSMGKALLIMGGVALILVGTAVYLSSDLEAPPAWKRVLGRLGLRNEEDAPGEFNFE